jgi:CubicO group peptidase (beta-lactamase class C family)
LPNPEWQGRRKKTMQHPSLRPRSLRALLSASFLCIASAALISCASQSTKPVAPVTDRATAIATSKALIESEMKRSKISGLSIVVADAKGTLWAQGFGKADNAGRPFASSTVSNAGSVSKLFTSTAIMRLVEQGKVDLDAPVSRYLPDFKPRSWGPDPDKVTVRSLLCHESGLQSDVLSGWSAAGDFASQKDPRPYAGNVALASATTLCWDPYTVFSYSNLGYSLLGLVVESASGMTFPEFVEKEILKPAGMDSSSFAYRPDLADRYAKGPQGLAWVGVPAIRDMPAGSFCTGADDMGRFLSAVLRSAAGSGESSGGILEPETLKAMWTRQNAAAARDFDFEVGLGWWPMKTDLLPGVRVYGHGGDLAPFHALLLVEPESGIGVFVLVNSVDGIGSFSLARSAFGALRAFARSEKGIEFPAEPEKQRIVAMPPELAERLVGAWTTSEGLVRFKRSGAAMKAFAFGNWLDADYLSDGSVALTARILGVKLPVPILDELRIRLEKIGDDDFLSLGVRGIQILSAGRASRTALDPAWKARAGEWIPAKKDEGSMLTISKVGFALDKATGLEVATVILAGQASTYPVASRSADELYLAGYGRNLGTTVRAYSENGEERIEAFGIVFKRKK